MTTKSLPTLLFLAIASAIMLFPFYWTFITSISPLEGLNSTPKLWPVDSSFEAYRTLFTRLDFLRISLNSAFIAAVSVTLQLSTGALAAYAFSRLRFKFREAIFLAYLATLMIPFQVLLVPLFVEMKLFGLLNTYWAAILPTMASAFGIFLMRQAFNQVPVQLDEAARIDGAGHFRIFFQVLLPNIKPALATFGIFAFMGSWNNFLWPLVVLRKPELQTLPVALANMQGQFITQWDVLMAGSVISIIPMLLIYVFAQRYVVQGVASSGIK